MFIRSCCSLVFLEPILLLRSVVALLVVLALVAAAIADLRHDGLKIESGRVGLGGQRLPPRRREELDVYSAPLLCCCSLVGFAGFVLVLVFGFVAANVWQRF